MSQPDMFFVLSVCQSRFGLFELKWLEQSYIIYFKIRVDWIASFCWILVLCYAVNRAWQRALNRSNGSHGWQECILVHLLNSWITCKGLPFCSPAVYLNIHIASLFERETEIINNSFQSDLLPPPAPRRSLFNTHKHCTVCQVMPPYVVSSWTCCSSGGLSFASLHLSHPKERRCWKTWWPLTSSWVTWTSITAPQVCRYRRAKCII